MTASRPLPERFWEKVGAPDPETGCLPWMAARNRAGYGRIWYGNTMKLAHRVAWFLAHDDWPSELDHTCRNKACVSLAHLEEVTHAENLRRWMEQDGGNHHARKTHCPQGHEFTPENTYVWRVERKCRACHRDRMRAYRAAGR